MTNETAIQTTDSHPVEVKCENNRQSSWAYRPNVDIFDSADELLLLADLPGADHDKIEISMEFGILTLQAEVSNRPIAESSCLVHEYGIGGFHRRFEINEAIDNNAVTAEYRDGSLTVHLPKAPQARRRRIPVSV